MGRLITEKVANLVQGVSQQAPVLRRPEQAEDQLNCWNSFIKGMSKRPGGVWQASYALPDGFHKDGAEWSFVDFGHDFGRYVIAADRFGTLAAWLEDGTPVPVHGSTLYTRLHNADPAGRKFTVLPYGAAAFVLNKAAPVMPRLDVLLDEKTVPLPITEGHRTLTLAFAVPENGQDYRFVLNTEEVTFPAAWKPEQVAESVTGRMAVHYPDAVWKQMGSVVVGKGPYAIVMDFADMTDGQAVMIAQSAVAPTDGTYESTVGFVHVKQGDYGTTYKVIAEIDGIKHTVSHKTPDGSDTSHRDQISLEVIRDAIALKLKTVTGLTVHPLGASGIEVRGKANGRKIAVWAEDDVNNNAIRAFDSQVSSEDDLPNLCVDGYTVKVSAKNSDSAYYLRYEAEGDSAGTWVETPKPLEQHKLWAETLPHLLVPENGPDGSPILTMKTAEWADRKTGDLETTPFPEVISQVDDDGYVIKTIASVGLYQSRLLLLGGPYLTMSRTNSFFDLFPASMLSEVATDPINLLITGQRGQMVNSFHVIPTEHDVLVLGDSHQVDIGSDTGVMSPESVFSKPKTAYDMDPAVLPALVGDSIYFIDSRQGYASVQQYTVRDSVGGRYAFEINQHSPTFLKGKMDLLVGTPQGVLFIKPEGTTRTAYVYQFIDNGDSRVQSAWSRWELCGDILAAEFREGNLQVLVDVDGQFEHWTHHLHTDAEEEAIAIPLRLDGRRSHGNVKPTDLREGEVCIRRGGIWFTGRTYMQRHVLSTLYFWNQALQQAITDGRTQVRRLKLLFRNTTQFDVKVIRKGEGRSSVREFRGRIIGSLNNVLGKTPVESGHFTVPVLSKNTDVQLIIENDGPHDACFLSAEWDGFYNTRTLQW